MIIFDLDGTLADCEHRRHFVDPSYNDNYKKRIVMEEDFLECKKIPITKCKWFNKETGEKFKPDWKSFHESCDKDLPIQPVIKIIKMHIAFGHRLNIWSGRCESVREKTVWWLNENIMQDNSSMKWLNWSEILKMRPIGDSTPDDELKEMWIHDAKILQGKTISFVFDDRPKVVRMWRRHGIFVFNCNQSDEEF